MESSENIETENVSRRRRMQARGTQLVIQGLQEPEVWKSNFIPEYPDPPEAA